MRWVYAMMMLCAAGGCTVGPEFVPPKPIAATWHDPSAARGGTISEFANPDPVWWQEFNDPVLTSLVQLAVATNPDLQQSLLRVVEAHQNEIAAAAQALPNLNANGSYQYSQLGLQGFSDALKAPVTLSSFGPPVGPGLNKLLNEVEAPSPIWQYQLSSSWELDLFGKVRRSVEQEKANTQAQVEAARDAQVMLEAQVGTAYVQLRAAQMLVQEQEQNISAGRQSLALTQQRRTLGLASELDVEQANTQLLSYEAQLPGYEKQAQRAINQLDYLTGQQPGVLDAKLFASAALPEVPKVIGIGIPSTLARRRPDIREAEAELHAATANVGVAVASFYPDISLTGNIGYRAPEASLLTNWASIFYAVGPSISLPIFDGGKLTANLRLAHAQQAAAALNYRSVVLNALREVEDALVAYRTDAATRDRDAATVMSATHSFGLAENRYALGLDNYLEVLQSERILVSSRQMLVQDDMMLASDVVALYTALGGGWQAKGLDPKPLHAPLPILPAESDGLAGANP